MQRGRGRGRGGSQPQQGGGAPRGRGRGVSPAAPAGPASRAGGDWTCAACGDLQFARNPVCRRCGQARSRGTSSPPISSGGGSPMDPEQEQTKGKERTKEQAKAEDWTCLVCADRQFARNAVCRRCGMNRPTQEALRIHAQRQSEERRKHPWQCLSCSELQYANKERCYRCHSARPTEDEVRRHKAEKRAARERAERENQAREEARLAEQRRKEEEMKAHTDRLEAAGWEEVRLLFIGAQDPWCILSRIPPELIVMIAKWASTRPACPASALLDWFRSNACKSPEGLADRRVVTYDIDPDGSKRCPEMMDGYRLEYHSRGRPSAKRFTVYQWTVRGNTEKESSVGHWSEAEFLAKASYDPQWFKWLKDAF